MKLNVADIAGWLEQLAPLGLAEEWDNVGLLIGSPQTQVSCVLTCVGVNEAVIEQAISLKAQLIVAHHPLIFHPLHTVRSDMPVQALVYRMVQENIALYCAHTNLDAAPMGMGRWVGKTVGICAGKPLVERSGGPLSKLVTYVPLDYLNAVRTAITEAGAGNIGRYSHCTFTSVGTGTFMPKSGTHPFIGAVNHLQEVAEARLETVVPTQMLPSVIAQMQKAHPYEEVAYDVFDLAAPQQSGYGWVGNLQEPCRFPELVKRLCSVFGVTGVRLAGPQPNLVQKVAVVNGSGASFMDVARQANVDVYITGDIDYHDAEKAQAINLSVVDVGHFASEALVSGRLATFLSAQANQQHSECEFVQAVEADTLRFVSP